MNFHQSRPPLTAIELKRRAAALTASQPSAAASKDDADVETVRGEPSDERQFGSMIAKILRDAKRGVALASNDAKFAVFNEAAATLAEAVAGQWLPKNIMVDRLQVIAAAHDFFGRSQDSIHEIIGEHSAKITLPISSAILPPLSSAPPS